METVKLIGTLLLVLGGFALTLWLAYLTSKFVGKRYRFKARGEGNIQVLQTTAVASDRQLLIVRACGKLLLLGSSPAGVTLITELDEAALLPEPSPEAAGPMPFRDALMKTLRERFPGTNGNPQKDRTEEDE